MRSRTDSKAIIAEHGSQAIMPCSYLGTEGILNGLNVEIRSSISWRTTGRADLLRFGRLYRSFNDYGTVAGVDRRASFTRATS